MKSRLFEKTVFFPFYGSAQYGHDKTLFVTPLYFRMTRDTDRFSSRDSIISLIIWKFHREYKGDPHSYYGSEWNYFKIWPLFRYESNDRGDVHFNALSILPFRDPEVYERIYDPLWSLVEFHRQNGVNRFGMLLRTYFQCWNDTFFMSRIPILYKYESENGKILELTFLFSMFGYERNEEGSFCRIFWLPVRVGDGIKRKEEVALYDDLPNNGSVPPFIAYTPDRNSIVIGSISL